MHVVGVLLLRSNVVMSVRIYYTGYTVIGGYLPAYPFFNRAFAYIKDQSSVVPV